MDIPWYFLNVEVKNEDDSYEWGGWFWEIKDWNEE